MIVGMVDDRALRFRGQVAPPPRPRPVPVLPPAAQRPQPSSLDSFAQNFLSSSQRRADDIVKYGGPYSGLGSRTADMAVSSGVSDNPFLRASAFIGDVLLDPANLIGIPAAAGTAKTVGRVAQLPPDTRQLYMNSLLGRLYHGNRGAPGSSGGPPPVLTNRGPQPLNWFQADTFLTPSKDLARTYAWDGLYRARVPLDVAENMNVLNLYNNPTRHLELANSPKALDYLSDIGANVVRHQSGHGAGAGVPTARAVTNPFTLKGKLVPGKRIEEPVYAFLEPAGIQMSRMSDFAGNARKNFMSANYQVRQTLKNLLDRINKTGEYDPNNVL